MRSMTDINQKGRFVGFNAASSMPGREIGSGRFRPLTRPFTLDQVNSVKFSRTRSIPSAETFSIPPITAFVKSYLRLSKNSADPFARNKRWATWTNDLNPNTAAEYHMEARDFLQMLKDRQEVLDLVLFDPPYSRRQVKEVYESVGLKFTNHDSQYYSSNWREERAIINDILGVGGVVLSFGWNTSGMGSFSNFAAEEILIVCHGGSRYDTLCIAERKVCHQGSFFGSVALSN